MSPAGVHELSERGHEVVIESGAGIGSSFADEDFKAAGAQILSTADQVWDTADLLLKVKEPIAEEYARLRQDQVLFTYLHLAASKDCTDALLASKTTSIARLREIDAQYHGQVKTITSNSLELEQAVQGADLVIGAVLVPGAKAPTLVSNTLVSRMKPGSVLVDIAIDQGGCFEDSKPTTHAEPTYQVHDSVFYCVANMPGAVPRTSTYALTNATLPYVVALADKGWKEATATVPGLAEGLSTHDGQCCPPRLPRRTDTPLPRVSAPEVVEVIPRRGTP
ncbi:alanine dehydrogenase [Rhodococcus sp. NPDC127530]|uniref:alanine dehydrogenase n=1 Tax=unclassified Rhodococcus (in: high G+C Gram-positive bacteria) TaxID=192944 RepID=UPI0036360139